LLIKKTEIRPNCW